LKEDKIPLLPELPGCYLMKDKNDKIIYVGKAKNLKKRVSQYFTKAHDGKTALMVSNVVDFDLIITNSEKEALILEANLIKKHDPKFNILLKDDKRYPYVKLNLKDHPYLEIARDIKDKKAKYFGPFSDSSAAYQSINLLNKIYPLRKCKNIPKKECLYYHLNMCLAPCINKIEKVDYDNIINKISKFYNGDASEVRKELVKKMNNLSNELKFEEANECKIMIEYLDHLLISQSVELNKNLNVDFFSSHTKEGYVAFAVFIYRNGTLVSKENNVFEQVGDIKENFESFITSYYLKRVKPKEIVVPSYLDKELLSEVLEIKVSDAKAGTKKQIMDMVGQNAIKAMEDEFAKNQNKQQVLMELKELLDINYPHRIDLFDNSHFAGDLAVGVKVCFEDGDSNKKLYRKYLIKGDNKKDDLASMREVVYRRLFKIVSENDYKPDLIIVDGGLNQLNEVKEIVSNLNLEINLAGLVKDDKHNTRALIDEKGEIIEIDKRSDLFFFLMKMQDEVHRYAITSHINKRKKSLTSSILDEVKGLGSKRKETLLKAFPSTADLINATVEEISQYVPINVAKEIKGKLENKE